MKYNFDESRDAWKQVPVEHIGYTELSDYLNFPDEWFLHFAEQQSTARYGGWRNHENKWRKLLHELEPNDSLRILDFGCGSGLESLHLAQLGHHVWIADINSDNIWFTQRLLMAHGYPCFPLLAHGTAPWIHCGPVTFDCFYANGVLHHTPRIKEILVRAKELLTPTGHVRLMLYSDKAWLIHCGELPVGPQHEDPRFPKFVSTMDAVGGWAEFYSEESVNTRFGDLFDKITYEYICSDDAYCVVTMQ